MKRSKQKQVEERVKAGVCIIDDCGCPIRSRGLCANHRNLFYTHMRSKKSEEERLEFEQTNIREGLILRNGEMRNYRRQSPFVEAG